MTDPRGKPDMRRDLFGGSGTVRVWNLLGSTAPLAPFSVVLECELDPGGSVGAHRQVSEPELVLGLRGRGRATVDGRAQPLSAHSVVELPVGGVLSIENLSVDEPLCYLIVKANANDAG
jgi:quercetin dioxygenase-like cupin family protein